MCWSVSCPCGPFAFGSRLNVVRVAIHVFDKFYTTKTHKIRWKLVFKHCRHVQEWNISVFHAQERSKDRQKISSTLQPTFWQKFWKKTNISVSKTLPQLEQLLWQRYIAHSSNKCHHFCVKISKKSANNLLCHLKKMLIFVLAAPVCFICTAPETM